MAGASQPSAKNEEEASSSSANLARKSWRRRVFVIAVRSILLGGGVAASRSRYLRNVFPFLADSILKGTPPKNILREGAPRFVETRGIDAQAGLFARGDGGVAGGGGLDQAVTVAVVGGGISGLMSAHTFHESNTYRGAKLAAAKEAVEACEKAEDGGAARELCKAEATKGLKACTSTADTREDCLPPLFDVMVFEASEHVGGHSWTVDFPLDDGSTYPVDIGYAYNPTMKQYEIVRAFDRANGIGWDGPLNQRIAIYKAGFEGISDEQNEAMDRQCDRFNMFTGFARNNGVLGKILFGVPTLRTFLYLAGFSEDFFLYRLYPVIRFVIVAGSKGAMLDGSAIAGMMTFISGWAGCYNADLHGSFEWYTIKGGSKAHLDAINKTVGAAGWIESFKPVTYVGKVEGSKDKMQVNWMSRGYTAPAPKDGDDLMKAYAEASKLNTQAKKMSAEFDAVIMATQPDDAAQVLRDEAPEWLSKCTTEVITVAVHSDESLMGKEAASFGPNNQTGPNMVYVANSEQGDYANAALSVYWDSIHGDHVTPRPILTYNPEALDDPAFTVQDKKLPASMRKKLKGEVLRTEFKHTHLPDAENYIAALYGQRADHNAPNARLFWAGAYTTGFTLSHPNAMASGVSAARSVGAHSGEGFFAYASANLDDDGVYEAALIKGKGEMVKCDDCEEKDINTLLAEAAAGKSLLEP